MLRHCFTFLCTLSCVVLLTTVGQSQASNFTWTGLDVRIPIDSKSHFDVKPIVRHNLDGNGYQNLSIDLFYKRNFDKGYFGQLLTRTWYLSEARYRQFLWLDIGKSWKVNKFSITQKFRVHYALDVGDNFDPDFIRSFTQIAIPVTDKLKLSLNLEPWLSLNDEIEIDRYRIEPGLAYKLNAQCAIAAVYRWQSDFRLDPNFNQNHFVTTLLYTLKRAE